jgi:hypothetical protein
MTAITVKMFSTYEKIVIFLNVKIKQLKFLRNSVSCKRCVESVGWNIKYNGMQSDSSDVEENNASSGV